MKKSLRILPPFLKYSALFLIAAGILLMAASYYILFYYTRPVRPFHPVSGHMDAGKTSFRVAMFSDCGLKTDPLKEIAADITQNYKPDFVMFLGDMASHGTPEEWSCTARAMRAAFGEKTKLYGTPGNHDVPDVEAALAFTHLFGYGDTYWKHGDTLFIMLNSAYETLDDWQFEWLESVLKEERASCRRCVLMTHVPPIDPNGVENHVLKPDRAAKLQALTDQYDVNMIVCGHVHVYTDVPFGKSRMVILPTSGQKIRDPKEKRLGYVRFDFMDDGSIVLTPVYVSAGRTGDRTAWFLSSGLNHRTMFFSIGSGCLVVGLILLWIACSVARRIRETSEN